MQSDGNDKRRWGSAGMRKPLQPMVESEVESNEEMGEVMATNWDNLTKEEIIAAAERINEKYVSAMAELVRYREILDKVKPEDLCETAHEREASLKNDAELQRVREDNAQRKVDRLKKCVEILRRGINFMDYEITEIMGD